MLVSSWFVKLALATSILLGQSVAAAGSKGCQKPVVRREWRKLKPTERADWIDAVKCLGTMPHNASLVPTFNTTYSVIGPINETSSYFDDWVYVHMDLNPMIHRSAYFLPWHRAYVKDFEGALRDHCGYKGVQPYWDWTLDANENFANSSFWDPDLKSGIGGWGDPNNDYQISDGGFHDFIVSYPAPNRVRRQYGPIVPDWPIPLYETFTPESQLKMVNDYVGTFIGFQAFFQANSHANVHRIVGGDIQGSCPANAPAGCQLGTKWSPNDPLFILHHSMIDKLWYDWQHANPENYWSFGGGATALTRDFEPGNPLYPVGAPPFMNFSSPIPTDGILNDWTMYELMDTQNQRLCYVYE